MCLTWPDVDFLIEALDKAFSEPQSHRFDYANDSGLCPGQLAQQAAMASISIW